MSGPEAVAGRYPAGAQGMPGEHGMSWLQPRSALFWVYCCAVIAGPILFLAQSFGQIWYAGAAAFAAVPITVLTLLVFGSILFWLDPFRARRHLVAPMAMGFIWGATVWTGLALWANDHVTRVITNLGGDRFASNWSAAIAAPIDEELIKAIGIAVVCVLFRPLLSRPIHGFLIGGSVGLGAQIAEDGLYSTQTALGAPQHPVFDVLVVAVLRLVTAFTSHWAMSALVGVGIVVLLTRKDRSWPWRLGVFALFYLCAVTMHFIFDAPRPAGPGWLVMFLPVIVDLAIFTLAYRWVLHAERNWLRATIAQPSARALGTEAQLACLLTQRRRRKARKQLRHQAQLSRRQAQRYEDGLIDRVQALS
ncbi:PrsW family glutamic-type intramembrane protease [Nocardia crassostreae]|uniref:PrsW family glutamic-type intramembrane protease n=1 Tax=Nocardia crassostreae TaxID=53428 RepID=UPI000830D0FD|nr:PrsW family glutamic-type intramembrane protease [Nocardia crassostreae]